MILRVRSRDGLERVSVDDRGTVGTLALAVCEQLRINPESRLVLSRDQRLLLCKDSDVDNFADMRDWSVPLTVLDLRQGDVVFLWCAQERQVAGPGVTIVPAGTFGKKMTIEDLVARQIRIERQDQPHCQLLSFDRNAANEFQQYVNETLAFSVQRGGFLYGNCNEEGEVTVDFIYEPPQSGTETSLMLHRDQAEERCVEAIAAGLGLRRVGFIFAQSVAQTSSSGEGEGRNYTLTTSELLLAAELHAEALGLPLPPPPPSASGPQGTEQAPGEGMPTRGSSGGLQPAGTAEGEHGLKQFTLGVVKLEVNEDGGSDVHFEAFQLSDQCVRLYSQGLFAGGDEVREGERGSGRNGGGEEEEEPSPGVTRMRREVVVARKDTFLVDNDFFLVPVKIADHEGPLRVSFPVENRIITATDRDLRSCMGTTRGQPYAQRLADFHLLLFLSHILDPVADLPILAEAVRVRGPVPEGYQLIIESF